MAKIDLVFSDKELKALKIRRKLKAKLRGLHGRMKRKRRKK
jgi:hypothetical protein